MRPANAPFGPSLLAVPRKHVAWPLPNLTPAAVQHVGVPSSARAAKRIFERLRDEHSYLGGYDRNRNVRFVKARL